MQAKDVMTTSVVTVDPDATVNDIAKILVERSISAVPVVDDDGAILGIVSEGDLMHRQEIGTDRRERSWWLRSFTNASTLAKEYAKSHGLHAHDVMTRDVITIPETTTLAKVAEILETNHIKRVPVVSDGKLVGIVSRANIIRGLATSQEAPLASVSTDDEAIRGKMIEILEAESWGNSWSTNVMVSDGVVELWGSVRTEAEREAARAAADNIPGIRKFVDRRSISPQLVSGL